MRVAMIHCLLVLMWTAMRPTLSIVGGELVASALSEGDLTLGSRKSERKYCYDNYEW
jgi:hypothetical protein